MLKGKINRIINSIQSLLIDKYNALYYSYIMLKYKNITLNIKKKEKIRVVFLLIHEPVWKYEELYYLLKNDSRFEPMVVVCPFMVYGKENMLRDMDQAYNAFLEKGYNVIKTYTQETDSWLDIKKEIKPDIVFFTIPHPVTKKEYYIGNFLNTLTCYVPYTFQNTFHYQQNYNRFFHNVLWRAYYQ